MNSLKSEYSFSNNGFEQFQLKHLSKNLVQFRDFILGGVDFSALFLNVEEYKSQPSYLGVNPRPGRNLAEKADTNFLFSDTRFTDKITSILGNKWRVLEYKAVVGLPDELIPEWVQKELSTMNIPNIGKFLSETGRAVTMFRGISLHQDIIDFPLRHPDFITVYIYLDEVTVESAPLIIIPDSHLNGPQAFPHDYVHLNNENRIRYKNKFSAEYDVLTLTGEIGDVAMWHPYILHGTKPVKASSPRVSLRLLIEKNADQDKNCVLDKVNNKVGPLETLKTTRQDSEGKMH